MTLFTKLASLALVPICAAGYVTQATAADNGALTITLENDLLTGSDNNYTNGLGVSWVSGDLESYDDDKFVSKWSRFWEFLPFVGDEGYSTYASWTVAQEMHTPDDITIPNPPADDQPYAGVLYIDSVLYARKERWAHAWELKLGVVGPASQADDVQKAIHDLVGGDEPMGWDTQLPDEPIINVGLTTAYRLAEGTAGESAEWRLIPVGHVGSRDLFHGCRTRHVRRARVEPGGCVRWHCFA